MINKLFLGYDGTRKWWGQGYMKHTKQCKKVDTPNKRMYPPLSVTGKWLSYNKLLAVSDIYSLWSLARDAATSKVEDWSICDVCPFYFRHSNSRRRILEAERKSLSCGWTISPCDLGGFARNIPRNKHLREKALAKVQRAQRQCTFKTLLIHAAWPRCTGGNSHPWR